MKDGISGPSAPLGPSDAGLVLGRTHRAMFERSQVIYVSPDTSIAIPFVRVIGAGLSLSRSGRPEGTWQRRARKLFQVLSPTPLILDTGWSTLYLDLVNPPEDLALALDVPPSTSQDRAALKRLLHLASTRRRLDLLGAQDFVQAALHQGKSEASSKGDKQLSDWFDAQLGQL